MACCGQKMATSGKELAGGGMNWPDSPLKTLEQPGFDITPAMRDKAAGGLPMFARNANPEGINALKALSQNDELYALPKSDKATVEGIVAGANPASQSPKKTIQ